MSDEKSETDLFGDPVVPASQGRGRPPHRWSRENSNKVLLAFARGLSEADAAHSIGITVKTLKKHYLPECQKRRNARLRFEMTQLERLNRQAEAGNVGAERELARMLDKLRMKDQHQADAPKPKVSAPKLGKKAAADLAAQEQSGLYEAPSAPGQLN